MSEENISVDEQQQVDQESDVKLSPVEEKARNQGWRPLEEWNGSEDDWVDAKTFVVRGELFDKIKKQRNEIDELRLAVGDLTRHHAKVAETEFKKALEYLKQQKADALESGNYKAAVDLDEEIATLKQSSVKKEFIEDSRKSAFEATFSNWKDKNEWYGSDQDLTMYADFVGNKYASENPGSSYEKVFEYVTNAVKKQFKEKFDSTKPTSPVNEPSGNRSSGKKSKYSERDLNEVQLSAAKRFASLGVMTVDEYIKQLVEIGDLK